MNTHLNMYETTHASCLSVRTHPHMPRFYKRRGPFGLLPPRIILVISSFPSRLDFLTLLPLSSFVKGFWGRRGLPFKIVEVRARGCLGCLSKDLCVCNISLVHDHFWAEDATGIAQGLALFTTDLGNNYESELFFLAESNIQHRPVDSVVD